MHDIRAGGGGGEAVCVSLSPACTLSNLGPLEGCLTAHLDSISVRLGLNEELDIPLTIQDCWLPTVHLPAFLITPNLFCLPA